MVMLSQEHFDKRMDGMMNLLSLIIQDQGEQNKALNEVRKEVKRNTDDIADLKSARSFWIRCAIGFSGFVTFLILMWKLILDRL